MHGLYGTRTDRAGRRRDRCSSGCILCRSSLGAREEQDQVHQRCSCWRQQRWASEREEGATFGGDQGSSTARIDWPGRPPTSRQGCRALERPGGENLRGGRVGVGSAVTALREAKDDGRRTTRNFPCGHGNFEGAGEPGEQMAHPCLPHGTHCRRRTSLQLPAPPAPREISDAPNQPSAPP